MVCNWEATTTDTVSGIVVCGWEATTKDNATRTASPEVRKLPLRTLVVGDK